MAEINQFCSDPITCYAQSGSSDQLALSPNNNLIHIYKQRDSSWVEESILSQHDLRVTSIDWAPKTNRIVTCSADRNAYVWIQDSTGQWKPTLVLLRINRAATCVKWSPDEKKFAVGTAARLICVCYFESVNDWWISRHIKKPIKSTVTSLDWHPNNIFLASGSTDFKTRIFSTYIKEVDGPADKQHLLLAKNPASNSWLVAGAANSSHQTATSNVNSSGDMSDALQASKTSSTSANDDQSAVITTSSATPNIGTLIHEFSNSGAWVHDVSFSPDGTKLAWVSHDSSISVVVAGKKMTFVTLKTRYLPFLSCVWVSQSSIVAAGHDCCPMLFNYQPGGILKFVGRLDRSQKKEADGQSAMRKFRDLDAKADSNHHSASGPNHMIGASGGLNGGLGSTGDSCLGTIHQNTIAQIRLYRQQQQQKQAEGSCSVATVGLDGKLVVWSLDPAVL